MSKITFTEALVGPAAPFGNGYLSVTRDGTAHTHDGVVSLVQPSDHAKVNLGPTLGKRVEMLLPASHIRTLAAMLNDAANKMDAGLSLPEPPKPSALLFTDHTGDTMFMGDLEAGKRLARLDREVKVGQINDDVWYVDLHDTDDYPAEYGAGTTEEQAWRYALGAYFGPDDDGYDEARLMESLGRGSWITWIDEEDRAAERAAEPSPYRATHVSTRDESTAMVVFTHEDGETINLVNEDGHAWTDDPLAWRPIDQRATVTLSVPLTTESGETTAHPKDWDWADLVGIGTEVLEVRLPIEQD